MIDYLFDLLLLPPLMVGMLAYGFAILTENARLHTLLACVAGNLLLAFLSYVQMGYCIRGDLLGVFLLPIFAFIGSFLLLAYFLFSHHVCTREWRFFDDFDKSYTFEDLTNSLW